MPEHPGAREAGGMTRLAVLAVVVVGVAGCGGGDDNTTSADPPATASTQPAQAPATNKLTVRMSEFAFDPKDATAKAGKVTITAPNDGTAKHELVLLKTDADPAKLPMDGSEVDESSSVGEIADV